MTVEIEVPEKTFLEEPEVEIEVEETSETEIETEDLLEDEVEEQKEIEITDPAEPEVDMTVEIEVPEKTFLEEPEVEANSESGKYLMDNIRIDYAPDPLTKEVMDNLAKNITLKIRLTKLLRDNAVKEETFKKLFNSYVEQGRLWVNRRDEITNRLKSDMQRMEEKLLTARKDHELLEIRKSIGDASESEYNIKAPAFKWDIEHLNTEIQNCTGGIHYLMNLKSMIPSDEVQELEELAQTEYEELENVENVGIETIDMMKESLSEALKSIQKK
jgi:hypothetical protein